MKKLLLITATVFFIHTSNAQTIDYFGQTPPGDTAKLFAPAIFSLSKREEVSICFSPDSNECYFNNYIHDIDDMRTYYTKRTNNTWSALEEVSMLSGRHAIVKSFSADNKKMYWSQYNQSTDDEEIWMSKRIQGGWGTPTQLPVPVNSSSRENSYSETADSIGYFSSWRPSNPGGGDIFSVRHNNDDSFTTEDFCKKFNSSNSESSPRVARDGSVLVFSSSRPGGYGAQDIYVSFSKGNNTWTEPVNIEKSNARINIARQVNSSFSPDGKYLFFCRHNGVYPFVMDIYWVSTHILDTLKKIAMPTTLVNQVIDKKVMLYPNPTTGHITLSLGTSQNHESFVEIYNLQGAQVFSKTFQNTTSATIDFTDNPAGIYVVKVIADGVSYEEKIVKE